MKQPAKTVNPCFIKGTFSDAASKFPTLKIDSESHTPSPVFLYHADPNCDHNIVACPEGGVKCTKCNGWFAY